MIIYGSGYFNKRDSRYVHDTCEQCGYDGHLHSYTSSHFFTLYFIPVIPLGSIRRLNECPKCKMGKQLSLKEWNKLVNEELQPAVADYMENMSDREKAEKAIGACAMLADKDQFIDAAVLMEEQFARDPEMLARLGWMYGYFGLDEAAVGAYGAALKMKDDDDIRQALAVHQIHAGRPEEASDLVSDLLNKRGADLAGLRLLEAQAWQAQGRHEEAIAALEDIQERFPAFEPAAIAKLRKISEKNLGTTNRVGAGPSARQTPEPKSPSRILQRAPLLIVPGLIVAAVLIYLAVASSSKPDHVYLINGLDQQYSVLINGEPVRLKPNGRRKVEVNFGIITLAPAPGDLAIDAAEYDLSRGLLARGVADPTLVINPDRLALILWEDAMYHENIDLARAPNVTEHIGESFYEFNDIDFHFRELPDEVETSSTSTVRTAVQHIKDLEIGGRLAYLFEQGDFDTAAKLARQYAKLVPEDTRAPGYLSATVSTEEFLKASEPHLNARPLLIEWHRTYQSIMEGVDPTFDLPARYREILQETPDDPAAMYLLGRILDDPAESYPLFLKATSGQQPIVYGYIALAYGYLRDARFDDAEQAISQAMEIAPDYATALYLNHEVRLAKRQYEPLIKEARVEFNQDPASFVGMRDLVQYYFLAGNVEAANDIKRRFIAAVKREYKDAETTAAAERFAAAATAEYNGTLMEYSTAVSAQGRVFMAYIAAGQPTAASKYLLEPPEDYFPLVTDHLMVYIRASMDGQPDLAAVHLEKSIELWRAEETKSGRQWAAWFSGDVDPPKELAHYVDGDASELPLPLVALGIARPDDRPWLFDLARKLNYDPDFPSKLLDEVIKRE